MTIFTVDSTKFHQNAIEYYTFVAHFWYMKHSIKLHIAKIQINEVKYLPLNHSMVGTGAPEAEHSNRAISPARMRVLFGVVVNSGAISVKKRIKKYILTIFPSESMHTKIKSV